MKAVLIEEFGAPSVMNIGEIDRPTPKANEVLIKVIATSVNRPDLVQRVGNYPAPPETLRSSALKWPAQLKRSAAMSQIGVSAIVSWHWSVVAAMLNTQLPTIIT